MLIQKAVPKSRVKTYATVLNLEFSFKSRADSKWSSVTNVSQTQHATPMQHVTTQKDLIHARVIIKPPQLKRRSTAALAGNTVFSFKAICFKGAVHCPL